MNNVVSRFTQCCRTLRTISFSLLEPHFRFPSATNRVYHDWIMPLRPRYPFWFLRKQRAIYYENISKKNREFIDQTVEDTYGSKIQKYGIEMYETKSPLALEPFKRGEWDFHSRRTGLVGKKIGILPLWTKTGQRVVTTLLQVVDNHVVKYIPPEEFEPRMKAYKCMAHKKKLGCLLIGADSTHPQKFTKEYCGLFSKSGVMPKNKLCRFLITPEAAIQPGTPLDINHFKIGQYVDVRGLTIGRGFQGVMKRWGFHGMPAAHGVTKTHRRPGCIGQGRNRPVKPGKKMPGHMGFRWRVQSGLKVLRINTKYNVMWVTGRAIPGETNSYVYIYDTNIKPKMWTHANRPVFPTYYPDEAKEQLPEDIYDKSIFDFSASTIMFEVPAEKKAKGK